MNKAECAKVLAKIQLGDNRQVDQLTLEEWFDTIGHLDFLAAVAGVRLHRQESTEYLMPAHVIRNANRVVETRLPLRVGSCRHRFVGGWCAECSEREPT